MEEFSILLIVLAVCCVLSGPVALIISIIALNKLEEVYRRLTTGRLEADRIPCAKDEEPQKPGEEHFTPQPKVPEKLIEAIKTEPVEPQIAQEKEYVRQETVTRDIVADKKADLGFEVGIAKTRFSLEQRIGTRWILIAGIITVIVGVGFFLKYAYDSGWIGPTGRVVIAAFSGTCRLGTGGSDEATWLRHCG